MINNEAIYIHVPWCRRRCPYCDFYIVVGKPSSEYISSLISEFEHRAPQWLKGNAQSLYFGGGTPSMLEPSAIATLITYLRDRGSLSPEAEITLEANPEDLNEDKARQFFRAGVNRLSLGIQSFDDRTLKLLGRMHKGNDAKFAIEVAQEAGLSNISVDLIIGVPGEDIKYIENSLDYFKESGIPHVSAYLLTIEEKTKFYERIKNGLMVNPLEDDQVDVYRLVQAKLKALNYWQYDISSYGLEGFFSRHNQLYWGKGNYLGLGPGAHSMRLLSDGGIERTHNKQSLALWLKDPKPLHYARDLLEPAQALRESLAFGLRNMHEGIDVDSICERHQQPRPHGLKQVLEKMNNYGWLAQSKARVHITEQGALFADAIMAEILSC